MLTLSSPFSSVLSLLMNFIAKVFAIISSATKTAYAGSKLINIPDCDAEVPCTLEENKNCNVRGRDYFGRITGNINSDIACEGSYVELLNNLNIKVDISRSTVEAVDECHSLVTATSSTLEMKSNKNIYVHAEDAWCTFEDNTNLNFKGKGGANAFQSQFVGNHNSKFTGKSNHILAFNNKNMLIESDNNHVVITGTHNHNVRPTESGSNENTFTIRSSGTKSIQFVVEYVDSAVIVGSNYQLGKIKFNAVTSTNKVGVTLNEADDVIYSVASLTSHEIIIHAESNGITQKLGLKGERVEAVGLNSYNIFVNSE